MGVGRLVRENWPVMLVLTNLCALCDCVTLRATVFHRKSFGLQLPGQARPGCHGITTGIYIQPALVWSGLVSAPTNSWHLPLCFSPPPAQVWLMPGVWPGWTQQREREIPVWVCALLVEPDQGRPGHWAVSHCDFVRKYWQQTFLYPPALLPSCSAALLLQLLSIIGQTVSVRLLSPHWDQERVTKPPAVESREDNWLTNCNTGKHYIS